MREVSTILTTELEPAIIEQAEGEPNMRSNRGSHCLWPHSNENIAFLPSTMPSSFLLLKYLWWAICWMIVA